MAEIVVLHLGALGDTVLLWPVLAGLRRDHHGARVTFLGAGSRAGLTGRADFRTTGAGGDADGSWRPLVDAVGMLDGAGWAELFGEATDSRLRDVVPKPAAVLRGAGLVVSLLGPADATVQRNIRRVAGGRVVCIDNRAVAGDRTPVVGQWLRQATDLRTVCPNKVRFRVRSAGDAGPGDRPASESRLVVPSAGRDGVVIHPGSGGRRKWWPLQRFGALAAELRLRMPGAGVTWVLGEAEIEAGLTPDRLPTRGGPDRVMLPESLPELAAVLAGAGLFVGNDAGPAHLAAVLGTPTVAVFRSTDPAVWSPWGAAVRTVGGGPTSPGGEPLDPSVDEVLTACAEIACFA